MSFSYVKIGIITSFIYQLKLLLIFYFFSILWHELSAAQFPNLGLYFHNNSSSFLAIFETVL
jgi:hypothetical protein